MNVNSRPIGGALRLTYMQNKNNMRVNGVNPVATASALLQLVNAINGLQDATVNDAFLIAEHELTATP